MEKILVLRKHDFRSKKKMLSYISGELGFPEYFGNNLDALFDCLRDISEPVNIGLDPFPADGSTAWYQGICAIFMDASLENENIRVFGAVHIDPDEEER